MKTKLPLTIIIILSLILGTIIFVIWPNISQIKKLSQAIYDQRVRLEKLYNQGQLLKKAREELKSTASQVEILNNLFVIEGKELEFITFLEELASKNKLGQKIEFDLSQQKKLKENYKTVPIRLALKGDFLDILKYLKEIEKMDYYLNFDSLYLRNLGEEEKIEASISGESYWKE